MISERCRVILLFSLSTAFLALGLITYAVLSSNSDPVVKTNVGIFQGLHASDGEYDMYLGIPYAQVNKSNVFGPAIPQHKLDTIFIADNDSAICPQFEKFNKIITGTLDCLNLNIYTPKFASTKKRHPVLVFIHGGHYKSGFARTSLYGPKLLVSHGIILVTLNYRLGPYGFICPNVPQIGNQGLKDQILALKWIKNNIAHFGGDHNKVTIAGVGSGGETVNLHLMYDKEDLFQKAIIESGIFLRHKDKEETSAILELAEELDFETKNESDALNYLNEQNVKSVIATSMKLHLNYGPCVEKQLDEAFIAKNRSNTNVMRVPVLIGHSNSEMMREYARRNLELREFRNLFRDELERHFDLNDEQLRNLEQYVREFYIKDEKVGEKTKQKIIDFVSDLHHNYPTKRMIDKLLEINAKVYYNVFSYSGGRNFAKSIYNISMEGATRGDVLGYLFDTAFVRNADAEDQVVIDYMTTLWANFVKHGKPMPEKLCSSPVKWEPVTKGILNYLEVTSELTSKITPFQERTAFWDRFYQLYGMHERITKNVEPWRM